VLPKKKGKNWNKLKSKRLGMVVSIIPALGRQRQKDHEFEATLGHIARTCPQERNGGREGQWERERREEKRERERDRLCMISTLLLICICILHALLMLLFGSLCFTHPTRVSHNSSYNFFLTDTVFCVFNRCGDGPYNL
jgi:hypothetical protein